MTPVLRAFSLLIQRRCLSQLIRTLRDNDGPSNNNPFYLKSIVWMVKNCLYFLLRMHIGRSFQQFLQCIQVLETMIYRILCDFKMASHHIISDQYLIVWICGLVNAVLKNGQQVLKALIHYFFIDIFSRKFISIERTILKICNRKYVMELKK